MEDTPPHEKRNRGPNSKQKVFFDRAMDSLRAKSGESYNEKIRESLLSNPLFPNENDHIMTFSSLRKIPSKKPGMMLFRLPNDERDTAEEFGLDPTNQQEINRMSSIEFTDPYPELETWVELKSRRKQHSQQLQEAKEVDEDLMDHMKDLFRRMGSDTYGAYFSKSEHPNGPFILISSEGIDQLAEEYLLESTDDRGEAWDIIFRAILYHEHFHFLSEYHCLRLTPNNDPWDRYLAYSDAMYRDEDNAYEEAVANAYAIDLLRKHGNKEHFSAILRIFNDQDVPYSHFKNFRGSAKKVKYGRALIASQHEKFSDLLGIAELNLDAASKFTPTPSYSVPVFVMDNGVVSLFNPGEAFLAHPLLLDRMHVTPSLKDEVQGLLDKLNDPSSSIHEKLVSSENGKRMWLDYNGRKAVFSQLRDMNGIYLVEYKLKRQSQDYSEY